MDEIGLELKIKRMRAKVSQTELADRMGVSQPRMSIIENSRNLREGTIARYLDALDDLEYQTTSNRLSNLNRS